MKDIKILEKAIKTFKKNQKRNYPAETFILIDKVEISAIENLIKRVKELENTETYKLAIIDKDLYISKDKIKEKIEELEKEQKECILYEHTLQCDECMEKCGIFRKIQVLQQLLEEQEE